MEDSPPYSLTAAIGCLHLERCRLGLVASRVSSEEAWCVVEEGIMVLVSVYSRHEWWIQHELYEQVNSPTICSLTVLPISTEAICWDPWFRSFSFIGDDIVSPFELSPRILCPSLPWGNYSREPKVDSSIMKIDKNQLLQATLEKIGR